VSKQFYSRKTLKKNEMWTKTGNIYYQAPESLNSICYDEKGFIK
jgi:hypothetical protein